jgi:protein TonB
MKPPNLIAVLMACAAWVWVMPEAAQAATGNAADPCLKLLASKAGQDAAPALASPAVRAAVCTCLKGGQPVAASAGPGPAAEAAGPSADGSFQRCVLAAVPVERVFPPSPALLAGIDQLLSPGSIALVYQPPAINLDSCTRPEYPRAALRHEVSGRTVLNYLIGKDGKVLDGEVRQSAGHTPAHKLLDFASFINLMQCRFKPATLGGQPVDAWSEVEYVWRIE